MEILYILFSVYTKKYLYNVLNTYCIYFFILQIILRPINRTKMQLYRRYQTNISSIIENNFQFRYNKCFYFLLWEIYTFLQGLQVMHLFCLSCKTSPDQNNLGKCNTWYNAKSGLEGLVLCGGVCRAVSYSLWQSRTG